MIYIYATGIIATLIAFGMLFWWVFINPVSIATERLETLENKFENLQGNFGCQRLTIAQHNKHHYRTENRLRLIEQATFGYSYAETSEDDFSKDGDVISTPAHQRANMGH